MPPVGQNRLQDLFEARCLAKTRTSDSLRPIAGQVAAKPRHPNAALGDRSASDWGSKEARAASNVSSGVKPITGSGASVMRYWALRLGREAPPCILSVPNFTEARVNQFLGFRSQMSHLPTISDTRAPAILGTRGRKGARGEPAGESNGWAARSHEMNTGKRPGAASVPRRLPAGQGCCVRCLRQPHLGHVREGHPEQRADTLCDRGRDERPR